MNKQQVWMSHIACVYIYSTVSAPGFLKSKLPRETAGGRGEWGALQDQCQTQEINLGLWCVSKSQYVYIILASIKACSTYMLESSSYSYLNAVMGGVTA